MCDYKQREYGCGHLKWIVAQWCNTYKQTHMRKCEHRIVQWELRADELCSQCRPEELPSWLKKTPRGLQFVVPTT